MIKNPYTRTGKIATTPCTKCGHKYEVLEDYAYYLAEYLLSEKKELVFKCNTDGTVMHLPKKKEFK